MHEASISNIVSSAQIPRGSFYQYFEDKDDPYHFLLSGFIMKINHVFISLLKKHEGDLFESMIDLFKIIIEEEDNFYLLRNAFLNMTSKLEDKFSRIFSDRHETSENFKELGSVINRNNLNINDEKDLYYVMQIISAVTIRNVVERFAKDLTNESALSNYQIEIQMLKNGLARE